MRKFCTVVAMMSLLLLTPGSAYGQTLPASTFVLANFMSWLPGATAQTTQPAAPPPQANPPPAQAAQPPAPPPPVVSDKPPELDCSTAAQSASPPDGNESLKLVQDTATTWQPMGGTTRFTIKGNDLSPGKFQVVDCFQWSGAKKWQRGAPLQVLDTKDGEITLGATLPTEVLLNEQTPNWFCDSFPGWRWAFSIDCGRRFHALYDGLGFVPVAYMRILAQGSGNWKTLDVTLPVGVTHHWSALLIALFFVGLAWWIVLRLAKARPAIRGGPFIRVITNRNGYASLSQFQITLWTFVIGGGAIYVMALSGSLIDIPAQALTLLGISGLTVLGASLPGATASANPPAPAANAATPGMASGLTTLGPASDTSVVLTWRAPDIGTPAAAYTVERKDGGGWTQIAGTSDPLLAVTGLTPNAPYQFRVTATDAQGTLGAASPPFPVQTAAAPLGAAPGAPGGVVAVPLPGAAGESGVTLNWIAPAGAPPDGYVVNYRSTPGTGTPWYTAGPIFGSNCTITGLRQGTPHEFRVAAVSNGAIGQWTAPTTTSTRAHQPGYADLIIWDGRNEVDVTRIQMLLFTVIAAAFVLLQIWRDSVIPDIPAGMLVLMGISNGVYLTAKFIPPQR